MAYAPLDPDQVVLYVFFRFPVFEAHVEDVSHARLALQPRSKLGNGLNDIDLLCNAAEEQAFRHAPDTTCSSCQLDAS